MKIMIVDNDASMLRMLKSIIMSSSIKYRQIIECLSAEEAITNYFIHKPDCVLMDVELDKMDGLEATKIIYAQDKLAKVIIVTSYDSQIARNKANEIGAKGFVAKDHLSDLIPIIKEITHSR